MPTLTKAVPTAPPSPFKMQQAMTILAGLRDTLLAIDPTIADDPRLFADMLEGEGGDAVAVIERVIRASIDADCMAEAAKLRKQDIAERQTRYERRCAALRKVAFDVLEALGLPRLEREDFTASVGDRAGKVIITDEKALPKAFTRTTIEPDKTLIAAELKAGRRVRGAVLSNPERGLTIRTR